MDSSVQFVYPKLMAWKGALGVLPPGCDGCVASTEFPVFEINEDRVLHEVLDTCFRTPLVWQEVAGGSTGTIVNPTYIVVAVAGMALVLFVFIAILARRYVRVGSNQVLIISGRKLQLPDGRCLGFRIVKGGGTFVFPVIEKVDVLSLEVTTIEMPRSKAQTAGGRAVEFDCVAQVKVNGDDASIVAAAEHFLSKGQVDLPNILRPVLEKHLSSVLGSSSIEEATQNPDACATRVQTIASGDLGKMGLSIISLTIRNVHAIG